jgi:hypothetical protein
MIARRMERRRSPLTLQDACGGLKYAELRSVVDSSSAARRGAALTVWVPLCGWMREDEVAQADSKLIRALA